SRKRRQAIVVTIGQTEFDFYILPFDKAGFLQSLIESPQCAGFSFSTRKSAQEPDYVLRFLSTRCGHPRRGATEKRDEIAPPHCRSPRRPTTWKCPLRARSYHPRHWAGMRNFPTQGGRPRHQPEAEVLPPSSTPL